MRQHFIIVAPYAPSASSDPRLKARSGRLRVPVDPAAAAVISVDAADELRCVPIALHGRVLSVATCNPGDYAVQNRLAALTGMRIRPVAATRREIERAIVSVYPRPAGAQPAAGALSARQAVQRLAFLLTITLLPLLLLSGVLNAALSILSQNVFALIGLAFGFFFFLYALKYYVTTALVLITANSNGGQKNGNGNSHFPKPQRQPFVSVHLPMYNEAAVIDRLLTACTSFDYDNYEVIVADDSTDPEALAALARWAAHPRVRLSHRSDRSGFKGGALRKVTQLMDARTEFVAVFDADFVPPPQILNQYLAYFYNGHTSDQPYTGENDALYDRRIAVVQGYQWHMLNAGENWLTRGIRAEFSGSYVIERPGQELLGGMKMISGSVFMIRADVLREVGWGTSITEDWELTIRLYLKGYKVLYTPYIQAPAEIVSDFRRLARQRMRWAEGHTYNVKKNFWRVLRSARMTLMEKLEFSYYAPYYLQSVFFMAGTAAWLISELVLKQKLPYWTALTGWSLVFSNVLAVVLMNLGGLFMEAEASRNAGGLLSFVILSTLLAPYQAYAAVKGLLEKDEGGWTRTPKSGRVTETMGRTHWRRKLKQLLPQLPPSPAPALGAGFGALARFAPRFWRADRSHNTGLVVSFVLLAITLWLVISSVLAPTVAYAAADPNIIIQPKRGDVGTTFIVKGLHFCADAAVTIYWDGAAVGTVTADSGGGFDNVLITVPDSSPDTDHTISAQGSGSGQCAQSASETYHVDLPERALALIPGVLLALWWWQRKWNPARAPVEVR